MKKLIIILSTSLIVWGCAKKMTPVKAETPSSNLGSASSTNSGTTNSSTIAIPPTNSATSGAIDGTKANSRTVTRTPEEEKLFTGQNTYNAKCGKCHGLKVAGDYTELRWVQIMQVMAVKANLDATEKDNVLAYVRANAKKG